MTSNDLITINAGSLPTILSADKDDNLGKLMAELGDFEPDGSTESGRKECTSNARKVSVTKANLIRLADTLKANAVRVVKGVNSEVKIIETRMDALRDRFLAPVEEYRNREKERVAKWERIIATIVAFGEKVLEPGDNESDELRVALDAVYTYPTDCEEFTKRAEAAKECAIAALSSRLAAAEKREAEAAELAQLRAEAEARRQREHDEAIAAKARADAEAKAAREAAAALLAAEREIHRIEQEAAAREARAKAEQDARDRKAAEVLAQAERDRVAAAEKAERERIEVEAAAKLREQKAAERERAKIEAQQQAEADERARREADIEHRKAVNRAAVHTLVSVTSIDEATARIVITAIAKGQVAGVSIAY